MYNIKLQERNIQRRRSYIDPILIEELNSKDEWLVETEEPCLTNDLAWLDEAKEDNKDKDILDVTAISENTSIAVVISLEQRDKGSIVLPWTKGKDVPSLMMSMRPEMISIGRMLSTS